MHGGSRLLQGPLSPDMVKVFGGGFVQAAQGAGLSSQDAATIGQLAAVIPSITAASAHPGASATQQGVSAAWAWAQQGGQRRLNAVSARTRAPRADAWLPLPLSPLQLWSWVRW